MSLRTATSRTYAKGRGVLEARIFAQPVNYQPAGQGAGPVPVPGGGLPAGVGRGGWEPIDNTLVASEADGGDGWSNTAGPYRVVFPRTLDQGPVVFSVPADGQRPGGMLGARLRGASGASVGVAAGSQVSYAEALPGVTVLHEATGSGAKESLLLASPAAAGSFIYDLEVSDGVVGRLVGNRVVFADAGGREVFALDAPFMVDAGGARSDAVSYALMPAALSGAAAGGSGPTGYVLSVTADPTWLAEPGRVWPVLVDPTTTVAPRTPQNTIRSGPQADVASSNALSVGRDDAGVVSRALIAFDVRSAAPLTAQVIRADMGLWIDPAGSTTGAMSVQVLAATRAWGSDATWNQATAGQLWTTPGGDTGTAGQTVAMGTSGYQYWAATDIVQGWLSGGIAQHGFLLKSTDESVAQTRNFFTDLNSAPYEGPFLDVRFVMRNGDVPSISDREFPLTDRSSAKVNLTDGNMLVQHADLSVAGDGIDLTLTRSHNSLEWGDGSKGPLGHGWRMNLVSDLLELSGGAERSMVYYAGDGSVWLFYNIGTRSSPVYRPAPGLNASLEPGPDGGHTLTFNRSGLRYAFDSIGRLRSISDRNNNTMTLTWAGPSDYRVSYITDTRGRRTDFVYTGGVISTITDPAGRQVSYRYAGDNEFLVAVTGADGKVTSYEYEPQSRIQKITTAGGRQLTVAYYYNQVAYITKVTDPATLTGPQTKFHYVPGKTTVRDPNLNTTTYRLEPSGPKTVSSTDPLGRKRSRTWSPNDEIASETDALGTADTPGNKTTYDYDTRNNPAGVTLPTGARSTASYTNTAQPYQPSETVNADGSRTAMSYDTPGNLLQTRDSTGGATGGQTVSYRRFGQPDVAWCGGRSGQTGQLCAQVDGRGITTSYSYNTLGERSGVDHPAPRGDESFTYDSLSRLATATDGKGQLTSYRYDQLDRIIEVRLAGATACTSTETGNGTCISYGYDDDGNRTRMTDQTGTTSYGYDSVGRQTSKTLPGQTEQSLTYDPAGNLTSLTGPDGTTRYGYDVANQLIWLAEPGGSCTDSPTVRCTRFGYDNNGVRTSTAYPTSPATTMTMTPDGSGRVARISAATANPDGSSTTHSDLAYTYSRPVNGTTTDGALVRTRRDALSGRTTNYGYDSLDQLTSAVEKDTAGVTTAAWSYGYDLAGNRTSATLWGNQESYAYNDANQMTVRNGYGGFSYDANGNETRSAPAGPDRTATYNPKDQTTNTTLFQTGQSFDHRYTGQDQNERTATNQTTFTSTPTGLASATTNGATTSFIRDPDGTLIAMRTGGNSYYYLLDNLGSVIGLVDTSGTKVNSYSYDPYGAEQQRTEHVANPYRYTGGYLDSTGLYKLGIRYYDPRLGRFTQPDPTGQDPHYTYAGNSPVTFIDPSGAAWYDPRDWSGETWGRVGVGVGCVTGLAVAIPTGGASIVGASGACVLAGGFTAAAEMA